MKKLYISFDFTTHSCGLRGNFCGVKGYHIIDSDGNYDASEYTEALNRILYVLNAGKDSVLITFGDVCYLAEGLDKSYGRLIRHWGGGKLSYVVWDDKANLIDKYDGDGSIPDRKLVKQFLDRMLEMHKQANS